jgi:feruloyl esterase
MPTRKTQVSIQQCLCWPKVIFLSVFLATLIMSSHFVFSAEGDACRALGGQSFVLEGDVPAVIGRAQPVEASNTLPAHCAVEGFAAPQVGFEVRLPLVNWNGRYLQQGCRGMCGLLNPKATDDALARGYAVAGSDMGHKAFSSQSGIWAVNNPQGKIDFGYRATHVTALAADTLISTFYGVTAKTKYFRGCGTGGRQALVEAQRYPDDFDGIIVNGGVVFNFTRLNYLMTWNMRTNINATGKHILSRADVEKLHHAVLGACDGLDGLNDGILSDPEHCDFDPTELACSGSKEKNCFSPEKVETARKMYAGPSRDNGEQIYPGMMRGSELTWASAYFGGKPGYANFVAEMMRYFIFPAAPGPSYEIADFDLNRSPAFFDESENLVSADSTDYSGFQARGGKILMTHGWNETAMPGSYPAQYYQRLAREVGSIEETRKFFRLYMIPGEKRCLFGPPEGPYFDHLSILEHWVEGGKAPDILTGYALKEKPQYRDQVHYPLQASQIEYERPFAPYPDTLIYDSQGDPADVSSYLRNAH